MHPRQNDLICAGVRDPDRAADIATTLPQPRIEPHGARGLPLDDDALLSSVQVRARVGGVSTMCIWRWMRDARVMFPTPVKINSRNYWRLGDLRRWQAERLTKASA